MRENSHARCGAGEKSETTSKAYLSLSDDVQIELFKSIQKKIGKQCTFFIVGDLKQSIYRFRGATISAFDLMKKGTLNGWKEYILNKNYRTDQKLLNKLNIVFSNLDDQNLLKYDDKDQLNSNIYIK